MLEPREAIGAPATGPPAFVRCLAGPRRPLSPGAFPRSPLTLAGHLHPGIRGPLLPGARTLWARLGVPLLSCGKPADPSIPSSPLGRSPCSSIGKGAELITSQNHTLNPQPLYLRMVRAFEEVSVKMRPLGCVPIQSDWCPYQTRFGHTGTPGMPTEEVRVRTQREGSHVQARATRNRSLTALGGNQCADTLILEFQNHEKTHFCCYNSPSKQIQHPKSECGKRPRKKLPLTC